MSETYRAESRKEWQRTGQLADGDLHVGCLQRIADATEKMAASHVKLITERDYYERCYKSEKADKEYAQRCNAALRGQITKLNNRIAELQGIAAERASATS